MLRGRLPPRPPSPEGLRLDFRSRDLPRRHTHTDSGTQGLWVRPQNWLRKERTCFGKAVAGPVSQGEVVHLLASPARCQRDDRPEPSSTSRLQTQSAHPFRNGTGLGVFLLGGPG